MISRAQQDTRSMYSPEQTRNAATSLSDRRSIVPDRDAETYRPVALPALAAAVRSAATAKTATREARNARISVRFPHEDTPLG
ncbi:hypothetical protein G3T14_05125 [Methylobacterium sp. BTF04]|uniref:hypothetical protein n=1 Tax=Methylobacterium sp. BTF04 TaxID=2708300 RepID=UPI0013D72334|nr:hypothetical protein [Methylobacterium sp. BTF04]NEU11508.1 hypothetical protein [Methylobacterium sp. BTF04]